MFRVRVGGESSGAGCDWSFVAFFFCSGGPEAGLDVGEDAVAAFDLGKAVFLSLGEGAGGFEALPDAFDLVELVVVGEETDLRVVARSSGGDEELPVGGFEQEEFAAELLNDALTEGGVSPMACGGRRRGCRARRGRCGCRSRRSRGSSRPGWCLRLPRSLRAWR